MRINPISQQQNLSFGFNKNPITILIASNPTYTRHATIENGKIIRTEEVLESKTYRVFDSRLEKYAYIVGKKIESIHDGFLVCVGGMMQKFKRKK